MTTWKPADGTYIQPIVQMAESHFQTEIDNIFTPDPIAYGRNISLAVVNQFYLPTTSLVAVCVDTNNKLLAYTWASSTERAPWSDDNMVVIRMAHVDLSVPVKLRIKLVNDMFPIWENFAKLANVPIICSTTMRKDQSGFLKLHERQGYDVRGSYAYKRIDTTQATPAY
jgi:hypothetical protein